MSTVLGLMDLRGRTAIITGATGGIGRNMATVIAEMGGSLILVDRIGTNYDSLKKKISDSYSVAVDCIDCDLESETSRNNLINKIVKSNINLDILVNNAAFVGESNLDGWVEEFSEQALSTWRRALEVNLTAPFHLSQGLAPLLMKSGKGSIINIASIYGVKAPDYSLYKNTNMGNPAAYSASKGGLIQLTRWLSTTIAPNIRVNSISPGGVWRNQPDEFVERYASKTPLGRMATEDDFNGIIAYLASDLSLYVTGQNFMIDGGWSV